MFSDPNRMSGRGASSSSARYENLRSRDADFKSLLPGNERPLVVHEPAMCSVRYKAADEAHRPILGEIKGTAVLFML